MLKMYIISDYPAFLITPFKVLLFFDVQLLNMNLLFRVVFVQIRQLQQFELISELKSPYFILCPFISNSLQKLNSMV
jgi:hypothetical protein